MYNNSKWEALYSNLRRSNQIWGMVANVLGKTGFLIKSRVMMYKVLVQAFLLYGSEICVVMDTIMMILGGFHHRIERRISGMTLRRGNGGEWE